MTNSLCVIATVMNTKDANLTNSLFVVTATRNSNDAYLTNSLSVVYAMINNNNAHMINILFVLSTMINVVDVVSTLSISTCDFGTCTYIIGTTASTKPRQIYPAGL